MSDNSKTESWKVGVLLTIAALFLPFSISGDAMQIVLTSGLWILSFLPDQVSIIFLGYQSWSGLNQWMLVFPQFFFVYQMVRFYDGKTTGVRVFIIWLLAVSPQLLVSIMNTLSAFWSPGWPYPPFLPIHLPSTLLVGILLIRFYPPPKEQIGWESESWLWWKEKESTHSKEAE